uniref:Uncharacterized protein n=1 Tax=viral metagenome TaxID=1070528 RepID=A0A6C0K114_9ZZZZ
MADKNSPNEALRTKKAKLVPAGTSRKKASPKAAAAPKTKKANVYKGYANELDLEELTAADKKIVNSYPVLANALGANAARAKVLETISKGHAKKTGAERIKGILANFEKALGRKLTKEEKEMVPANVASASKNEILHTIRIRPYKALLKRSPTSAEVDAIQKYTSSNERRAAEGNARKELDKAFIKRLKAISVAPGEEPKITAAMVKARTARLKRTKEETDTFDAAVARLKPAAKTELASARSKKTEPAAKDVNALARIRAHGMELTAEEYLLIQYDQDSEEANAIIETLSEAADSIDICAMCEVANLLKHI